MGLDIAVMIVDWSWLGEQPPRERLSRLRDAWYADETGLWDHDRSVVEGDWEWPRGRDGAFFAVYEFLRTCGSFKAHFRAGHRWESLRDHADPLVRAELDALLLGLIWQGLDGKAEHTAPGFFCDDPEDFTACWSHVRRTACGNWPRHGNGYGPGSAGCADRSTSMPRNPKAGSATSAGSPTYCRIGAASSPKPLGGAGASWD
ncbi:hypothetical protein [Streptomyces sp. NBC_01217]|uniref:hypothetical protein n=1 Tax=Streptomyces sp. NBC_01217 TaxID=2903779 RepID=UPI002E0D9F38|nr:hypothetical protein OG507_01985 [Streptomyces sp. NBC_01217]